MNEKILTIKNLVKKYRVSQTKIGQTNNIICPVNNVNLKIVKNKNLGIAGESGSGKTTLSRLIGKLESADAGEIYFQNQLLKNNNKSLLNNARKSIQYIFQELYETLNPKRTVFQTLIEPLKIYNINDKNWRKNKVNATLESVGLGEESINKYPHELSGGQRQRVAIARSIILNPKLIIADEPISALDLSVRAQIINLLIELQIKLDITYVIISHDLSVLRHICDHIVIYYAGTIVEYHENSSNLFKYNGWHPYTRRLMAASFCNDDAKFESDREVVLENILSPDFIGCRYYNLCPNRTALCKEQPPKLSKHKNAMIACHFPFS